MDTERSRITQQAVLNLLRTEQDDSREAREDFLAFARGSVHNVRELLLAQATLKAFERVDPYKQIDLEALPKLPELPIYLDTSNEVLPAHTARRQWWWAASAAAILVATLGWLWTTGLLQSAPVYTTGVGEQRTLKLPDGSTVFLNTDSRVKVAYSDRHRQIRLLQGEALFQVERDTVRPFQVITEDSVVQALGTEFNVYRRPNAARVSVIEGAVQISSVVLKAGEEADVSGSTVRRNPNPNVTRATAWRTRQLMFDNQALGEVASEFNRYNRIHLTIQDERLRAVPLSGTFDVDDPEPIIGFITRTPSLRAEAVRGKHEIVIQSREDGGS